MVKDGTLRAKKTLIGEQPRIAKYFPDVIQKTVARNYGNIETQRDILLNHVQREHPSMSSIFNDNYYREVDEFIEFIENKNVKLVEEAQSKKMGIKPSTKAVKVDTRDRVRTPVIKSKTKTGKEYTRQKSRKFEDKRVAVAFITKRVNEGKTNKQITEEYNMFATSRGWGKRTVSSISTLKSREKIRRKNNGN